MDLEARVQELVATGDARGAATEAIRALGPDVLRYLRFVLRDENDAEEAFSLFAEAMWRYVPSFRGDAALRTWALRVGAHAAARIRRDPWRRRVRRFVSRESSAIAGDVLRSSAALYEQEAQRLDELRAALSEDERALLVLRVDQRLSWREIAEVLSAPGTPIEANTVCKRFERLKGRLARLAQEQGLLTASEAFRKEGEPRDGAP